MISSARDPWVYNYRYPIWYPRDSRSNYVRFHDFLRAVSYSFQNEKGYRCFPSKEILKFFIPTFVTIISD